MSTNTQATDDFQTCSLCKRRYNIDVYQRHITENQCIKRNQHRLPFQSIKQRTIRIGDRVFSVQQQKNQDASAPAPSFVSTPHREQRKPATSVNTNNNYRPTQTRASPVNRRQATLAQARQLLERRTKYQPPWIQKRSNVADKISPIVHPVQHTSSQGIVQRFSAKEPSSKFASVERASPPRTLFPTDDLPIKPSDRYVRSQLHQPILTQSPKLRSSKTSRTPNLTAEVDQTFTHESVRFSPPVTRKAKTWTRPAKPSSIRTALSPIDIPTFAGFAAGPLPTTMKNQNYDDDVFERYSPSPPSTPRAQQCIVRPITYQRAKRSDQQQRQENPVLHHTTFFSSAVNRGQPHPRNCHLPPLKVPSPRKYQQYFPTSNFRPWR